jgi:hypothetical protein
MVSKIKEHPILFSTEMVKAILENRKTMTRRVVKPQPRGKLVILDKTSASRGVFDFVEKYNETHFCPYGQVGDRLWVRETCQYPINRDGTPVKKAIYKADLSDADIESEACDWDWNPSIFMPRWASRITLKITNIKVERLQEITEEDAIAEGIPAFAPKGVRVSSTIPRKHFASLWDKINSKNGYEWSVNPWVWVISFWVVEHNK